MTSLTPNTKTHVMPYMSDSDVYILHDLSNLSCFICNVMNSDIEKKRKRWELDAMLLKEDSEKNPSNTRTVFYLAQV